MKKDNTALEKMRDTMREAADILDELLKQGGLEVARTQENEALLGVS